jgi:hypothetical protein
MEEGVKILDTEELARRQTHIDVEITPFAVDRHQPRIWTYFGNPEALPRFFPESDDGIAMPPHLRDRIRSIDDVTEWITHQVNLIGGQAGAL